MFSIISGNFLIHYCFCLHPKYVVLVRDIGLLVEYRKHFHNKLITTTVNVLTNLYTMNKVILVSIILITIQLKAFAWPNNLVFTLKPNNVELLDKVETKLPVFTEKDGITYIGRFIHPDIAKIAQVELQGKGMITEVLAFFRTKPLPMEDALILIENMNSQEEYTMLSGTKSSGGGGITFAKVKDVNAAYYTLQVGVYTHSVKDNFSIDVREVQINGEYYYFYGKYDNLEKSKEDLEKLQSDGFNDAFITGFSLGQKVSAELLEKMLKT